LGLGEATYVDPESIYAKSEALNTKIAEVASKYGLRKQQFGSGFVNDKGEFVRDIPEDLRELQKQYVENRNINPKTTKFKQWSLPSGENYREIVLTLPDQPVNALAAYAKYRDELYSKYGKSYYQVEASPEELNKLNSLSEATSVVQPQYRSSHWDEPNPLAHLRMSDRVTDGKKTLLVDEVQSDWHQAGRERGYANPEERQKIVDKLARDEPLTDAEEAARLMHLKGSAVPNAPYKEDWYQLALRRAVKEAIDGGYDRVALPTGARVNERFSLTKQINEIHYSGSNLKAYDHNGNEVISQTGVRPEDLPSYVGKETANKLLEQPKQGTLRSLVGQDLEVGGEGNKEWYDKIYPGYLKKFGKKYGAGVGTTGVVVPPDSKAAYQKLRQYEGSTEYINGRTTWSEFLAQHPEAAKDFIEPLHYMDITPAMRKEFSTGIHMAKGGKVSFASNIDAMRHELNKRQ
jgi:hypothetical protein